MKFNAKLPYVVCSLFVFLSIFFPYASFSLIDQSESGAVISQLFDLGPIAGYKTEIGIGIGIITFASILVTCITDKKSVVLWVNFITSILCVVALALYYFTIKNAFNDSGFLTKLIAEKTFSVKVSSGVYIGSIAAIFNLIFCFLLSRSDRAERSIPAPNDNNFHQIDWAGQIEKLADLKERGIITTKEYLNEKNEILKNRERYYHNNQNH